MSGLANRRPNVERQRGENARDQKPPPRTVKQRQPHEDDQEQRRGGHATHDVTSRWRGPRVRVESGGVGAVVYGLGSWGFGSTWSLWGHRIHEVSSVAAMVPDHDRDRTYYRESEQQVGKQRDLGVRVPGSSPVPE